MYGVLQDRQVVYTLSYLYTALRTDSYLLDQLDDPSNIVRSSLARAPIDSSGSPGKIRLLNTKGMPYLALWREGGERLPYLGSYATKAKIFLCWVNSIPRGDSSYDGETWASTWATNIWHRSCMLLEEADNTFYDEAGIDLIHPLAYDLDVIDNANYLIMWSALEVNHLQPPYVEDDLIELQKIIGEIQLYGTDGYTGLSVDLELDVD